MCVELFLEPDEIQRLKQQLPNYRLFDNHDQAKRREILTFANLEDFKDLDRTGDSMEYFMRLYPCLVQRDITLGGRRRLALIVLLESILPFKAEIDLFPNPAEAADLFRTVVRKYDTWDADGRPGQPSATTAAIAAALRERRAARQAEPRPVRRYKLDRDAVLIGFDLLRQVARFLEAVQPDGLSSFSVCGSDRLLRRYVIARIRQSLSRDLQRTAELREVYLTSADLRDGLEGAALVQQRLCESYGCVRLTDLVADQPVDTLLVIWNTDMPAAGLQAVAASFLMVLSQQVAPVLVSRGRLMIVVWASIPGESLEHDSVHPLPPVQLRPDEIVAWLRPQLVKAKVEATDVEWAISRLQAKPAIRSGYTDGIYAALEEILEELQLARRAA